MSIKRFVQVGLIVIVLMATFAHAGSAQAWGGCGGTYWVQPGDWLAKIARKCGVSLNDLYNANSWLWYRYYIHPGDVLVIPGGYSGSWSGPCGPQWGYYGSYYVVCRGDTLGGIALYYGVSIGYLKSRNHIWNANYIQAGQVIWP